jgi:type IV pilus biogenesis/stability protein PilW
MQVKYWQNSAALFKHALAATTDNAAMHERYATALFKEGRFDQAVSHYNEALRLHPELYQAHAGLGLVFLQQGKTNEAIECFKETLQLKPDYALVLNNLGALLAAQGKIDEATGYFEKAIRSDPDYLETYYNIVLVKIRQKQYSQAIDYLQTALQRKPDWPEVCSKLAETYFLVGNMNQAVVYWRRTLDLHPNDIKTLNNLAWVLATTEDAKLQNPTDAVKYARRISELLGPYPQPVFLDTLAAAYAAAGDFPQAVRTAEEALRLLEAVGNKDLAQEIRQRLDLYKSGRPYREKQK